MRKIAAVFTLLIAGLLSSSVFGQKPSSAPTQAPPSVELPKGSGAWALRVVRTGGFTGESFMDITIVSTGQVIIDSGQRKQTTKLAPEVLHMWNQLVSSAKFSKVEKTSDDFSSCHDCYWTAMTLRRRESGKDRGYSANWVPTTAGSVSEDFITLSRLALAIP